MFSILLLSCFQCLNKFEIVVWDIFSVFSPQFVDLAAKLMPIGDNFKAESHQVDSMQTQNLAYMRTKADYSALLSKAIFGF